jgi:hypothetical protein
LKTHRVSAEDAKRSLSAARVNKGSGLRIVERRFSAVTTHVATLDTRSELLMIAGVVAPLKRKSYLLRRIPLAIG